MRGGRLVLVALLVVLAGCAMPLGGVSDPGEPTAVDDRPANETGGETTHDSLDDGTGDDTTSQQERTESDREHNDTQTSQIHEHALEPGDDDLTTEQAAHLDNVSIEAQHLHARLEDTTLAPRDTRALLDGNTSYVHVALEIDDTDDLARQAGILAGTVATTYHAGILPPRVDNDTRRSLPRYAPQADAVSVAFHHDDTPVASMRIDTRTINDYNTGHSDTRHYAAATVGNLTLHNTHAHQHTLPSDDTAPDALPPRELYAFGVAYDAVQPDYTTFEPYETRIAPDLRHERDGTGYDLHVTLDEDDDPTTALGQTAHDTARTLNANRTLSTVLDTAQTKQVFGPHAGAYAEYDPPDFVDIHLYDHHGDHLTTMRVHSDDARDYWRGEVDTATYAQRTIDDHQYPARVRTQQTNTTRLVHAAQLRWFAHRHEFVATSFHRQDPLLNNTYIDTERNEVQMHVTWPETHEYQNNEVLASTAGLLYRTFWYQPRHHQPHGLRIYAETQDDRWGDFYTYAPLREARELRATTDWAIDTHNKSRLGNDWIDYTGSVTVEYAQELHGYDREENPFTDDSTLLPDPNTPREWPDEHRADPRFRENGTDN